MSRFVGSPEEVAATASTYADFPVLLPRRVPLGSTLSSVLFAPGLGSGLTLEFRSWGVTSWTLTQRVSSLSFDEELSMVGSSWERRQRRGRSYAYAASSFLGEPVERHLTASRQTLWWNQGDVMVELERIAARHSPGWWRLWRVVDNLEPIAGH